MAPDQRPLLDGFSLVLPFPYRVAVILVAGMLLVVYLFRQLTGVGFWAWGFNLEYLLKSSIVSSSGTLWIDLIR